MISKYCCISYGDCYLVLFGPSFLVAAMKITALFFQKFDCDNIIFTWAFPLNNDKWERMEITAFSKEEEIILLEIQLQL